MLKKLFATPKRTIATVISTLAVVGVVVGVLVYNSWILAIVMRVERLVGEVNMFENGNKQEIFEQMRLRDGQSIITGGQSLITISLDNTKLMTMEESSLAYVRGRRNKLQFDLVEGNLFFNVNEKLKDDETFEITTTTMTCGIRGTSAYVGNDSTGHEVLMVTDGVVHVDAVNPVTGEKTSTDVYAGEMITIYLDEEAEGNATISIVKRKFREEDLPALALNAIDKDPELKKRIGNATGFYVQKLEELAIVTSTPGISMYGKAADELKDLGIADSIPYMGFRSAEMTEIANRAADVAGEDLPLEIAIIKGLDEVMQNLEDAGCSEGEITECMTVSSDVVTSVVNAVSNNGVSGEDLVSVAQTVSATIAVSVSEMENTGLSQQEIINVVEAIGIVFSQAVSGQGEGPVTAGDILNSIAEASNHCTETVSGEMDKESDGDETVIALLGRNTTEEGSSEEEPVREPEEKTDEPEQAPGAPTVPQQAQIRPEPAPAEADVPVQQTPALPAEPEQTPAQSSSSSSSSSSNSSSSSSSSSSSNSSNNQPTTYAISLSVNPQAGGSVGAMSSSTHTQISSAAPGETVLVQALAGNGYDFSRWTNPQGLNLTSINNGAYYSFVMPSSDVSLTAEFSVSSNPSGNSVTCTVSPAGSGTVSGTGTYQTGQNVTLTASPSQGYTFTRWDSMQGIAFMSLTNPSQSFKMPSGDVSLTAIFSPQSYTITYNCMGGTITATTYPTSYNYGTGVKLPTSADLQAPANKRFRGWFQSAMGGSEITSISSTDSGDKTFYAQWQDSNSYLQNSGGVTNNSTNDNYVLSSTAGNGTFTLGTTSVSIIMQASTAAGTQVNIPLVVEYITIDRFDQVDLSGAEAGAKVTQTFSGTVVERTKGATPEYTITPSGGTVGTYSGSLTSEDATHVTIYDGNNTYSVDKSTGTVTVT